VSLDELRTYPELDGMVLLNRSRLSVQPVTEEQFDFIVAVAERAPNQP
jgi:predicted RNA-binding protein with PUA-like domain